MKTVMATAWFLMVLFFVGCGTASVASSPMWVVHSTNSEVTVCNGQGCTKGSDLGFSPVGAIVMGSDVWFVDGKLIHFCSINEGVIRNESCTSTKAVPRPVALSFDGEQAYFMSRSDGLYSCLPRNCEPTKRKE